MTLELIFPTLHFSRWQENKASWGDVPIREVYNVRPLTAAYQQGFEQSEADILGFVHDDVSVYDPDWKARVLKEFEDPKVGLVGFGGSTGHGHAEIYEIPYSWDQVGREGQFMSNMVNAEQHGMRITDARDASVLDGFAMFVRREVLGCRRIPMRYGPADGGGPTVGVWEQGKSGWPQNTPIQYWGYDLWLSCETRRQGYKVRVVGVSCEHSAPSEPRDYVFSEPTELSHKWLYENYRDVFPARAQ